MSDLSPAIQKLLKAIERFGDGATTYDIGDELYGRPGVTNPQRVCRPAGALLKRAERMGLVKGRMDQYGRTRWTRTQSGS